MKEALEDFLDKMADAVPTYYTGPAQRGYLTAIDDMFEHSDELLEQLRLAYIRELANRVHTGTGRGL